MGWGLQGLAQIEKGFLLIDFYTPKSFGGR